MSISISEKFQMQLYDIERSTMDKIIKSAKLINICKKHLLALKNEVLSNEFSSQEEEIDFFKNIKQAPLSGLIYYIEVYSFELEFPKVCAIKQEEFIIKCENKINEFFTRNIEFVRYIELEQTHLDSFYFVRKNVENILVMNLHDYTFDPLFNTSHDLLLAKIYAYKRFISYLNKRPNIYCNESVSATLKWTSSKVALTELIYALYYSRVINHGNIEIKQIAIELQKLFNFELGDFYKIYSEMRVRKKSRTKFLDELSLSLITEFENKDS